MKNNFQWFYLLNIPICKHYDKKYYSKQINDKMSPKKKQCIQLANKILIL